MLHVWQTLKKHWLEKQNCIRQINLSIGQPTSHIGVLVQVPAPPVLITANAALKAADDGSNVWISATHAGDKADILVCLWLGPATVTTGIWRANTQIRNPLSVTGSGLAHCTPCWSPNQWFFKIGNNILIFENMKHHLLWMIFSALDNVATRAYRGSVDSILM